ncbi:MAG: MAC/perforin domain-containing protein [Paludibacter sp.]
MKLKKHILPLFLVLMYSCSDNLTDATKDSMNQNNVSSKFKVRGDNKYDVLGFAFDATGPYLDIMKTTYPVIDVVKLQAVTGLIASDDPIHSELDIKSGSDAKTLLKKYSNKFSIAGAIPIEGIPFTASLSADFDGYKTTTSKYSYAIADMNVYVSHHTINKYTPLSTLQSYLTDNFKNDLLSLTPEQIISLYGTHVYTEIYTGGKMRFTYKSYVNNSTKESSASYGAKVGVTVATNTNLSLSATTSYTITGSNIFQQESMAFSTIGGTGASPLGTWTPGLGTSTPINFNQWSATVSKTTASSLQLIDVGDNSLMAIYEFVADPIKKAALKTAVDNYIMGKAITVLPVVPLYRYSDTKSNHFYTTNWNEIGIGGNNWYYEGIQAFIFQNQETNTVPFYRFYKNVKKKTGLFSSITYTDHYYTTVKSSGDNNGYINEGIIGFVYTTPTFNTVGLRQYYNSSIFDHFYTTNINELGNGGMGYSYNGDCCYVIEGTK